MRIWILSDIHVDSAPFTLPDPVPDCGALVLAGDVDEGMDKTLRWMRENLAPTGIPVVFVPGNHDYYAGDIDDAEAFRAAGEADGFHMLVSGQSTVIDGVRFVGATLWTDFAIAGDVAAAEWWAQLQMPDYNCIDRGMRRLRPRDLRGIHALHRSAIGAALATPFDGKTVVVTHHAPHARSLRDGRATEAGDAAFASDLSEMIELHEPALWVHGHVHDRVDYHLGKTHVVANPRGYVTRLKGEGSHRENRWFHPGACVTI